MGIMAAAVWLVWEDAQCRAPAIWITGRGLSPLGDSGMAVLSAVVDV